MNRPVEPTRLEIRESSDLIDDQRKDELGELRQLSEMLGQNTAAAKPARV